MDKKDECKEQQIPLLERGIRTIRHRDRNRRRARDNLYHTKNYHYKNNTVCNYPALISVPMNQGPADPQKYTMDQDFVTPQKQNIRQAFDNPQEYTTFQNSGAPQEPATFKKLTTPQEFTISQKPSTSRGFTTSQESATSHGFIGPQNCSTLQSSETYPELTIPKTFDSGDSELATSIDDNAF